MPDQTAIRITQELINFFSAGNQIMVKILKVQCTVLKQSSSALKIHKSYTTPYHPQRDGIVEHFNRSLLHLL